MNAGAGPATSMTPEALVAKYEALLPARPDDELLHFSLGKALYDAGRFPEAEEHLRTALAARADWMVVTMLLAQCALRRGDAAGAKELYGKALQFAIDQQHEGPEEEIRTALTRLG
jgi:Flp pilus assembly protein TadD